MLVIHVTRTVQKKQHNVSIRVISIQGTCLDALILGHKVVICSHNFCLILLVF